MHFRLNRARLVRTVGRVSVWLLRLLLWHVDTTFVQRCVCVEAPGRPAGVMCHETHTWLWLTLSCGA